MNGLAVAIAITLLPGIVASVICDKITVHSPRWEAFKYSIYSFLFGILSYCFLQTVYALSKIASSIWLNQAIKDIELLKVWEIINNGSAKVDLAEVMYATLLAPVVAVLASAIVNYKLINKLAKKCNISQKYGDENLFSFFLNAKEVDWIYVRDKDVGLTYFGRVVSHSECDKIQEVVLSEVTVHEYETSEELYSVPIIYLSRPLGSFSIEVPIKVGEENNRGKEAIN